jgi:hypothetical protein
MQKQEEIISLQEDALHLLRTGTQRPRCTRELHVLVLPSFDDCRSYEYFQPHGGIGDMAVAVRTVWRREVDLAKLRNPVDRLRYGIGNRLSPTLEHTEMTGVSKSLEQLLEMAKGLRIPAAVESTAFGVDGTTYQLSFGHLPLSQFSWWGSVPVGWERLEEIVHETEAIMSR